jgi:hypothetical protein
VAVLNELLKVLNPLLPPEEQLARVEDPAGLHSIRGRIAGLGTKKSEPVAPEQPAHAWPVPPEVAQAFARIGTNAWRAQNKMVDSETGEPKEEMKRVYRHIEAVLDALAQIGVSVMDPRGRAYDSGMALKVVSIEQTPGLSKETITETVRPSISWQTHLIQIGEVIVGTPQAV